MGRLLAQLVAGGVTGVISANRAEAMVAEVTPLSPVEATRKDMALEHLDDLRRFDTQLKASRARLRDAVTASRTQLTERFGFGSIVAAIVIGHTSDVRRFKSRDAFASYSGTAPIELSSGGRVVHRLSLRGNRKLDHALHIVAIVQIRYHDSPGRAYYERKLVEGKPSKKPSARSRDTSATPSTANSSPRPPRPADGSGRATRDDSDSSVTGPAP